MTSTSAQPRPSTRSSPTRLMLRWAIPLGLGLTVVGAAVAWLVVDGAAAVSALVGGLLSVAVFGLGIVAIRGLLSGPGQIVMSGAFFVFQPARADQAQRIIGSTRTDVTAADDLLVEIVQLQPRQVL